MKKLLLTNIFVAGALALNAQTIDELARESQCKAAQVALDPIIKSSENPKRNTKANTWVRLGDAYISHTNDCGKDSTSAFKAFESFTKALEVDAVEGGKAKASIEEKLKGEALYSALMNQGVAHYNAGNMVKAELLFGTAMKVDVKDTLSAFYTGIVAQQNANEDMAKMAFSKYLDNGGIDPAVFYSLSSIYKKVNDFDTSIEILKKGIIANPSDKDLRGELINIYLASNKTKSAIEDLEKLVEAEPTNSLNLLNLGILYESEGNMEKALNYYSRTLEVDPNNYEGNFNMGVYHFNNAVNIKKEVDAMDMKTYQKEGKAVEVKVCAAFNASKPYFEKCSQIKPNDEEVKGNLETLAKVLSQCN